MTITKHRAADPADRDWMFDGPCIDTPVDMHPEDARGTALAKAVCRPLKGPQCAVLDRCLAHALDHHEQFGVWGATSQRERTRIWKQRQKRESMVMA